jgi:hypothetical protein
MATNDDQIVTRYVARRLNKKLLDSLMPPASAVDASNPPVNKDKEEPTGFSAIWEGAKKIGVGLGAIFQNLLSTKKTTPISQYKKGASGPAFANLYGYYLVVLNEGRIKVFKAPGLQAPPKTAEVFLIADLKGLSLARVSGTVNTKDFNGRSVGQFDQGIYAIDLWLDPGEIGVGGQPSPEAEGRIGRFLQNFMSGRDDLTLEDFCERAQAQLNPFVRNLLDVPVPQIAWEQGQETTVDKGQLGQALDELKRSALQLLGLTTFVRFRPGSQIFRHQITLDENTLALSQRYTAKPSGLNQFNQKNWQCASSGCKHENDLSNAFCEECGSPKPSAVLEASVAARGDAARRLISADGEQLVFDLAFVSYDQPNVRTDEIASQCIEVLRPICQKLSTTRFGEVEVLQAVARALNERIATGTLGPIGEFSIIDFRSADTDWRLQTRAQIREQLRELEGQQAQFEIADADFALRQAQRIRDVRDAEHNNQVERDGVAQHRTDLDIDFERQQIDAKQKVDENRLFVEREIDMLRDGRTLGRETRRLDREDLQEATKSDRSDQLSQLDHEMGLENKVLAHDLSKEQLLSQAKLSKEDILAQAARAKAELDASVEDRLARLRATRGIDIISQEQTSGLNQKRSEQELDLNKQRSVQELDLNKQRTEQEIQLERVRLEHELQLQKLKMLADIDIAQKEQFKGMTPAQMLAMQAKLLVDSGQTEALGNLTSADAALSNASVDAKVAETKAEMLERMLAMQKESNESSTARQMEVMMAALNAQKESAAKVEQVNERTVASAERWNEKSIDAMAKVAATAAGNKGNAKADAPAAKDDTTKGKDV